MPMYPFDVVRDFEKAVAQFTGAPRAVAVDCCTNAIFLSCISTRVKDKLITIPDDTYVSVPNAIKLAGGRVKLASIAWKGYYQLAPFDIIDSAKDFYYGMYTQKNSLVCLSFHAKKHLPIGRGGMILCPNNIIADKLSRLAYDGRCGLSYDEEDIWDIGYHMYMTPDQAARGLFLLDALKNELRYPKPYGPESMKLTKFELFEDMERYNEL